MDAQRNLSQARRALVAVLVLMALTPLGASHAAPGCDPAIPPEVCGLLPSGVDTLPIDQSAVVGRTYVPSNPTVKTGSYLYMHNFDTAVHFWIFSNGQFKRLDAREFGPLGQKLHISTANGFIPGSSYPFFCATFPEMQGELSVTP